MERLKKLLTSSRFWLVIFIILLVALGYKWYIARQNVKIHNVNQGVSESIVKELLDSDGVPDSKDTSKEIIKKIEQIKIEQVSPIIVLPPGTPEKDIQAEVNKDNGDLAIREENSTSTPGTSIYSIHLDKSKHGIGIYGAMTYETGQVRGGYGLHYRNKRWVYQAGVNSHGGFDGRIAYEVAQW